MGASNSAPAVNGRLDERCCRIHVYKIALQSSGTRFGIGLASEEAPLYRYGS